jgi:succinoglycan biosynthesis transport protein ExoP
MGKVDVPLAGMPPRPEMAGRDDAADWSDDSAPALDLRAVWSTVFRNRYVMIAIVAAAILLGVVSVLVMPRIYTARASVQIDQQVAKVLGTEDTEPVVSGVDADRFLQTQVDVLKSRAMAGRVAERLGLAANDKFLERMTGSTVTPDPKAGTRLDRVIDTLERNLSIDMRRNSRVVGIFFTSRDPALAAEVANSFASNYIEGNIQRKFSTSAYSREFLQTQLGLAKGRLEESERTLIAYSRQAQLIDATAGGRQAGTDGPRSLVTANLVQLNTSYAEAEAARVQARQRWEQARATPLMSLPEVLTNEAIQRLVQKRAESVAEMNELRQRLKPEHPTVEQASAELAELDVQIRTLARSVLESIRNQYLTAERQHQALEAQVNVLKSATLNEQDRGVRYNILKREVDTNRQLYESLLQRYKEVSAESGIATNNVTVVDTAEAPRKPTSPRPLINLALALLGGIALALAYAFGREYLDDAIRDPQDIEAKLNLPVLGVVPEREDGAPLEALEDAKSDIAEAYHSIRTSIELSSNQGVPRSIVITSSSKSEGKSTSSFALARDFALLDRKVLLIDADLRRPSLHRLFNMTLAERGLSTALARLGSVDDAIVPTGVRNLSFLPSGPLPPDPASLFAGSAISEQLQYLMEKFDVVVIDGPPVLALADATQLSAAAHATVFVTEAGGAHFGQVRNAISRLQRAGGHLIGVIVTKYNARKAGYGYSYDYYRYRYDDTTKR